MGFIETLWDLLGKKLCLVFGKECGSACIWMMCSLLLRALLTAVRLEHHVPTGFIFAFPYFIQVDRSYIYYTVGRSREEDS